MKTFVIAATVSLMAAAPLFAQEAGGPDAIGYVTGVGGFSTSIGGTTGDWLIEGGARIAPHLMVIGNIGRFGNLQSDLQPTLDATTAALAANQGSRSRAAARSPPRSIRAVCGSKSRLAAASCHTSLALRASRASRRRRNSRTPAASCPTAPRPLSAPM
jgi:hypothetical protein